MKKTYQDHSAVSPASASQLVYEGPDFILSQGARCSSVVRAFAHGAMGRRIDPSWSGPTELFLVPASAPQLVYKGPGIILSQGARCILKDPLLLKVEESIP